MVKVKFCSTAQRYAEEIVSGEMTVREYLEGKGALMSAMFTINGKVIKAENFDMPLGEVYERGYAEAGSLISIVETAKTAGAR